MLGIDRFGSVEGSLTFIVAFRTLLQTNRQIGNSQVGRSTREAGVLAGTGASFTGFMARPANAALIWETPWRASTYTSARTIIIILHLTDAFVVSLWHKNFFLFLFLFFLFF